MTQLILHLLGPPTVEWEGAYLNLRRRQVRALLFRLALELKPVARDHLANLFWPNQPDSMAHRELTHLLTHLRSALPHPGFVQCAVDYVYLDPHLVWSDTSAFLALFAAPAFACDASRLRTAVDLCRGPLMEGFYLDGCAEFEEWLTLERSIWERRMQLLAEAVERAGSADGELALSICGMRFLLSAEPAEAGARSRLAAAEPAGTITP